MIATTLHTTPPTESAREIKIKLREDIPLSELMKKDGWMLYASDPNPVVDARFYRKVSIELWRGGKLTGGRVGSTCSYERSSYRGGGDEARV
ncbi:hypothetical protein BaRGS_00009709 [Batillaria attramentaria]|uniref:Uncharacterized protein n=1 Tax=Batillaria attramentaria TaxID=370345 RepID=A0ABD0LIL5_9CAEN